MAKNVCSRPPITIRSHDLHAGDVKRGVGEIASYHGITNSFPSLVPSGCASFWPFFGLPFYLMCDGSNHWGFLLDFLLSHFQGFFSWFSI